MITISVIRWHGIFKRNVWRPSHPPDTSLSLRRNFVGNERGEQLLMQRSLGQKLIWNWTPTASTFAEVRSSRVKSNQITGDTGRKESEGAVVSDSMEFLI